MSAEQQWRLPIGDAIHIAMCCDPDADPNCRKVADAVLPEVAKIVAAELRAAADDPDMTLMNGRRWLRDRADRLDPQ